MITQNYKKKIKNLILSSVFCLLSVSIANFSSATEGSNNYDLLQQAFDPAIQTQSVIGWDAIGTTTESVGNYVLNGGTDVNITKDWINASKRTSLLIQITRFILRMTVVLAVTMIIYNGVQYMIKASKWENPKDILSNIYYIIAGILLALLSIVIVRLTSSVGMSSLGGL